MTQKENKIWIQFLKLFLFLIIGASILLWVYTSQNKSFQAQCQIDGIAPSDCNLLHKIFKDFLSINPYWTFLVFFCFQISNLLRAFRWQMIFKPMGYNVKLSNAYWTIMVGYFANLGLSRAGEVIRAGSLSKVEKIRVDTVIGTVTLDRLLDLVTMSFIILLAFVTQYDEIFTYLSGHMRTFDLTSFLKGTIFQCFAAGMLLIILLLIIFKKQVQDSIYYIKIIKFAKGFYEGIRVIKRIEKPFLFIVLSMLIWAMYFLMTYFAFFSFDPTSHLGLQAALLIFVFGSFGIVIPSPGGMGTYHALVVAACAIYGIQGDDAFSFANIIFFNIQIFTTIIFGIAAFLFLKIGNRNYVPMNHLNLKEIKT